MSIADVTIKSVEYASDSLRWECETHIAMEVMHGILVREFGTRCKEAAEGCPCCKRWKAFDELFANPFEEKQ